MSAVSDGTAAWDLSDADNPQPLIWPVCPTCKTPWVWRQAMSFSRGTTWLWMGDCKHKREPVLHTKDGAYETEATA